MTFSRLFFLATCAYAVLLMSSDALDKNALQIPVTGKPGQDFGLEENEISDLEFLRGLYPGLTNDQLLEVKERLDGYFDVALETFLEKYKQNAVDE